MINSLKPDYGTRRPISLYELNGWLLICNTNSIKISRLSQDTCLPHHSGKG